ncbi:hypothetical protein NQ315_001445 [Exocentrus adspersus]|uniref:Exonuclease domain-containing protein n=1 Tax=Exocentrus adspersus TaxID=1586481 RepID=A0AAV8W8V3_9CUCU|nr:hypothetical protein NQ315_001445 [Exocentrus adspersus]
MENSTMDLLTHPSVLTALFIGAGVLIFIYILKLIRKDNDDIGAQKRKTETASHSEKRKEASHAGKSKKKLVESKWTAKNEKSYNHPWLLTSLKGHTGSVLDIDFSSNGKYLASCGDEDPDSGSLASGESSSSSSECNKEGSRSPSTESSPRTKKGLSRRQRKNRRREQPSSTMEDKSTNKARSKKLSTSSSEADTQKTVIGFTLDSPKLPTFPGPVGLFEKLLRTYMLSIDEMLILRYPVDDKEHQYERVLLPRSCNHSIHYKESQFDVNAREFVPRYEPHDSGHGSSSDSGDSLDWDESSSDSSIIHVSWPTVNNVKYEHTCVRCGSPFYTTDTEYITKDQCRYHWGRLRKAMYYQGAPKQWLKEYSCCRGKEGSPGCCMGSVHVWNGSAGRPDGIFVDYVRTLPTKSATKIFGVYAIDCEMCYTVRGLECTKVTLVDELGRLVYDTYVKPDSEIVDYNTRFSGITPSHISKEAKTLFQVQRDLLQIINANTVLIGHGLENDLRALRIMHCVVVDTAHSFPHVNGLPYKQSLKSLAAYYLDKKIQCSNAGHDSFEDALTCMELMLWRVRKDFNYFLQPHFLDYSKLKFFSISDRTVFIWDTKDLTQKERKSLRVNIEFDYATLVKWSPDSKAFVINKFNENTVEVYKVEKKKDGWLQTSKALTFPKTHETDIIGMGIASNGRFIMTCSNKTDLVLWDLKGQKLGEIDTYLINTVCAKISPCGRFIVATGFTPEARVWEVVFNKSGEFMEIKQVKQLTLGGHSSGVYDIAFDVDCSHMATVSKDGTWHLYDTKVNYKLGEDVRIVRTGKYEQASSHSLIALSPNSEVIVIATFNTLSFYSTLSGDLDYTIENVYSGKITSLLFDSTGKYLLTAGDKQIRVFHNVTGYRCNIQSAKEKLKESQTSATRERLQKLVADSQAFLSTV